MRSTNFASGHAVPRPQACELVVVGRRASAEDIVVEGLGGSEQCSGPAGEGGLAANQSALALEQLPLERFQRFEHVAVRSLVGVGLGSRLGGEDLLRGGLRGGDELQLGLLETEVGAKPGTEICCRLHHFLTSEMPALWKTCAGTVRS